MINRGIPREDLYYPYVCHAYWHHPKKFHVIYFEGLNDPKIIKTFDDPIKGRAYAKELNIRYLNESGWYLRDKKVSKKVSQKSLMELLLFNFY